MHSIHRQPVRLMSALNRDIDRLFATQPSNSSPRFVPAVDIDEEAERFIVRADLPGVDAEAIDIRIDSGLMTLSGQREPLVTSDAIDRHRTERATGTFERSFRLPKSAANDGVSAEYRHGVLTIEIPKAKAARPYRIEVTAN